MFDPVHLKTFLLIAEGNSFSEASRKLGLRQSTVSEHVRKLEICIGRKLFMRDTHNVALTVEGEALIEFARTIMETNARAEEFFAGSKMRGRLRFGASEDLVLFWLPEILSTFVRKNPQVDFELTIALSSTLIARFDAGEIDVVFCKRWPGEERGELIWRDELVWIGSASLPLRDFEQVPLVIYPPPSLTRFMALASLEAAGIPWRISCTSGSLSGLTAAAQAGLGVMAHAKKLTPEGLIEMSDLLALPHLGDMEFILLRNNRIARETVSELAAAIHAKGRSFAGHQIASLGKAL